MQHFIFGSSVYLGYDKSIDILITWVLILSVGAFLFLGLRLFKPSLRLLSFFSFDSKTREKNWLNFSSPNFSRSFVLGIYWGLASAVLAGLILSLLGWPPDVTRHFIAIAFFVSFLGAVYASIRNISRRWIRCSLWFSQILISLLVLNGAWMAYGVWRAQAFFVLIFVLALCDVSWRLYKTRGVAELNETLLSALPWISLVFIYWIPSLYGSQPPVDDYHWGEYLLAGQRVFHGEIPYVDFLPAHGLVNVIPSLISQWIFGEMDPIYVYYSLSIFNYALFFLAGYVLSLVTPWPLVMILLQVLTWGRPVYALLAALLVWFIVRTKENSKVPFLVIGLFGPVLVFLELGIGASFGVAIAIVTAALLCQKRWRKEVGYTAAFAISAALVLLQLVFLLKLGVLQGAVLSLMENSKVNLAAYGIPWASTFLSSLSDKFGLNFFRLIWIGIVGAFLAIAVYLLSLREKRLVAPAMFWVALSIPGLMLIGYAMGRVDPGAWSRTGMVSSFYIAMATVLFLPAVLLQRKIVLVFVILYAIAPILERPHNLATYIYIIRNQYWTLLPGSKTDLSANSHFREIDETKKHFNQICKEKPFCFFDLTNRNALYSYFGDIPDLQITAFYNTAHPKQEARTIESLRQYSPSFILVKKNEIYHDGGSPSLRTPRLWQELIRDRSLKLYEWSDQTVAFVRSHENVEDAQVVPVDQWFKYIATTDLGYAPAIWGRQDLKWLRSLGGDELYLEPISSKKVEVVVPSSATHILFDVDRCSTDASSWKAYPKDQENQVVEWKKEAQDRFQVIPLGSWPQFTVKAGLRLVVESDCDMTVKANQIIYYLAGQE